MALADEIIDGNKANVLALLDQGADINEIDRYGFTPLVEAAIMDNLDIAALLVSKGADVDAPDVTGRTALHWASDNTNLDFCKLLLSHKANANAYTIAGQPPLVLPLLRKNEELRKMLCLYGANLAFAQDFINTKLIGHRFEMAGVVDIVNHLGNFIELDFEGFFLEFTLNVVQNSLMRYKNHFSARHLRGYFHYIARMVEAFATANELIHYQHYNMDLKPHLPKINRLLQQDLLLIPVAYEGHAICFIKYGNWLAKCDRGEGSRLHGSVVIYQVDNPEAMNKEFFHYLIYKKQTRHFVFTGIHKVLKLTPLTQLPLPPQITGNCSWANIEAAIPTMLFLLLLRETEQLTPNSFISAKDKALYFYKAWQEWDKDAALYECIEGFNEASPARRASKAALMGNILFQRCNYTVPKDVDRAEKMLPFLTLPEYRYVLESYLDVYWRNGWSKEGANLTHLLELCGVEF